MDILTLIVSDTDTHSDTNDIIYYMIVFWELNSYSRLHGHAIFGVVSVSDTGTGTTSRILVFGGLFFFLFFFASPTRPTRQQ